MANIPNLFDLAARSFQSGNWMQAELHLREAIGLDPSVALLHSNLGLTVEQQGRLVEAAECFRQALHLDPSYIKACYNLGKVLFELGRLDEAAACYRQALDNNPGDADAAFNLGNVLLKQGKLPQAAQSFQQALHTNPDHVDAHASLGIALNDQGRHAEAIECYRQVLRKNPTRADVLNNLGFALDDLEQFNEAIACFKQALHIDPNYVTALLNLGNVFHHQGQLTEAALCYRQALQINPANADAFNNLGNVLKDQGLFDEAAECIQQALKIDPGHKTALVSRSFLRLLRGDFEEGWKHFELRWTLSRVSPRPFTQPRWDGSPLGGKTILLYAEGGLGDTIQFLRFFPQVKERGGTLLFECQPALFKLLIGHTGADQIVAAGKPLPSFDVQAPLTMLPGLCGTALATIPADVPYLAADAMLVQHWRQVLEPLNGFKIGIAWQGSLTQKGDRRSLPLKTFEKLARIDGVHLISLQVGPGTEQVQTTTFPVTDMGSRFDATSVEDLAAVLMNLDLVITVDTLVAHLAGALGMPVWVALSSTACWRWLLQRSDSPWYPTMRLFRQKTLGDWDDVFETTALEIRKSNIEIRNKSE